MYEGLQSPSLCVLLKTSPDPLRNVRKAPVSPAQQEASLRRLYRPRSQLLYPWRWPSVFRPNQVLPTLFNLSNPSSSPCTVTLAFRSLLKCLIQIHTYTHKHTYVAASNSSNGCQEGNTCVFFSLSWYLEVKAVFSSILPPQEQSFSFY